MKQGNQKRGGGRASAPLLLFKCLPLQKRFQIKSDPELESRINDQISFKSFLSLPMDCPSLFIQKPGQSFLNTGFKELPWGIPEVFGYSARIDGIPTVMTRSVRDMGDESFRMTAI